MSSETVVGFLHINDNSNDDNDDDDGNEDE